MGARKKTPEKPKTGIVRDKLQLGLFDMEKRLAAIEQKVATIYQVSLDLDNWLKEQKRERGERIEDEEEDTDTPEIEGYVIIQYGNGNHYWYKGKGYRGQDDWTDDLQKAQRFAYNEDVRKAIEKIAYWPDRGDEDVVGFILEGEDWKTGAIEIHPEFAFAKKAEEQQQAFTTRLKKVKKEPKSQWIVMCEPEVGDTIYLTVPVKISGWRKYWSTDEEDARKFDSLEEAEEAQYKYQELTPDEYQDFYVQVIG